MEVWGGNQAVDNGVVMPGLDAWVFSRPYAGDASGGDVHYVSSCATGRITRLLVADVSGHGAAVSEIALKLRTLMRRYVNYVDQAKFVQGLNREFGALAGEGGAGDTPGHATSFSFATAVVATYFAPTDQFILCNAGHPRPMWYHARKRRWELLDGKAGAGRTAASGTPDVPDQDGPLNIPFGIAEIARYDQLALRLARDDLVLIYTDSLIEASDPASGRMLGEAGLLGLLNTLDTADPATLIPTLLAAVEAHVGGHPPDDVTVLLLRPNTLKPATTLAARLNTNWQFLKSVARGVIHPGEPIPWPEPTIANLGGAFLDRLSKRVRPRARRTEPRP